MTSEWLAALLTSSYGENGGFIEMTLAIGGFLCSEFFFILVVSRKLLKARFSDASAGAAVIMVFQLLLTLDFEETFGNTASYGTYIFSYIAAVLLAALMILQYEAEFQSFLKYLLTALFLLLSVLTASGVWVMALAMLFLYIVFAVWCQARGVRGRYMITTGAMLYLLVFLTRVFSPVTQAELAAIGTARNSLIKTVWYSVKTAVPYTFRCLNVTCAIGALLLVPLFVKMVRVNRWQYPLPVLTSVVSFGFFVTLFFPSLYTSGLMGGTQVLNIYRWVFYLLLYGNEAYWVGWYMHRDRAEKLSQNKYQLFLLLGMTVLILLAVVVPLFVISHYNFLSADDLWHGSEAAKVWRETHSAAQVAVTAAEYVAELWQNWQGVYASGWLSITLIGIFAEDAYYVGTYLGLGGFVLAELVLFMMILHKLLGADMIRSWIVSLGVIALQILLTDVPVEAFYWFTSAICYTGCYNAAVLLCAILIRLYFPSQKRWRESAVRSSHPVVCVGGRWFLCNRNFDGADFDSGCCVVLESKALI